MFFVLLDLSIDLSLSFSFISSVLKTMIDESIKLRFFSLFDLQKKYFLYCAFISYILCLDLILLCTLVLNRSSHIGKGIWPHIEDQL